MSDWVKVFIKNQLNNIDNNNWKRVFKEWYRNISIDDKEENKDIEQFEELLNALKAAGVSDKIHLPDRLDLMRDILDAIIKDYLIYNYNHVGDWKLYWNDVINDLYGMLGLTKEQIYDILSNYDEYGVEADPIHKCFNIEGM